MLSCFILQKYKNQTKETNKSSIFLYKIRGKPLSANNHGGVMFTP